MASTIVLYTKLGPLNNTDSCYQTGLRLLSVQLLLVRTDRLLMPPPLWGDRLTQCMFSEGEQRSSELSARFYATPIFQSAHNPFQTKSSSICQSMKLIVQHRIIIEVYRCTKGKRISYWINLVGRNGGRVMKFAAHTTVFHAIIELSELLYWNPQIREEAGMRLAELKSDLCTEVHRTC